MTETDIECGHTTTALYARGINKGCKMITFSHLNSSDFTDHFKDSFMQEEVKSILVVLILSLRHSCFSSSLRLGAFSNCFLMTSFTSLLVTPLICNAQLLNWINGIVKKIILLSPKQLIAKQLMKPSDFSLKEAATRCFL